MGGLVSSCPQQQAITWTKFRQFQQAIHTPKSFMSVMAPTVTAIIAITISEALLVSPCVLTSQVSIALKGMPHMVYLDNWQSVWKYSMLYIRSFKRWLCCHTLFTKLVFLNLTSDSFKCSSRQQTLYILQSLKWSNILYKNRFVLRAAIII